MKFNFDQLIDFRNGDSLKWNRYADRDVLPLWVADMDFAAPPAVVEALQRRVARATFGYAEPWPTLVQSVSSFVPSAQLSPSLQPIVINQGFSPSSPT